jgi:hypothetical protein
MEPSAPGDSMEGGGMTTVAPTGQGTGAPAPDPYRSALAYLLALVRGEASLNEHKAIASTAVCESHRRGLTDSRRSWSGEATSPSTPPSSPWMRHDLPSLRSHRSTRLARTRRRRVTTATSPGEQACRALCRMLRTLHELLGKRPTRQRRRLHQPRRDSWPHTSRRRSFLAMR